MAGEGGKQLSIKPTHFIVCLLLLCLTRISEINVYNIHTTTRLDIKILAVKTGFFLEGQSQLLCLAVTNYDRKRLPDDYELLIQKFALEGRKLSGMVRVCPWEKTPIQSGLQVHTECLKWTTIRNPKELHWTSTPHSFHCNSSHFLSP